MKTLLFVDDEPRILQGMQRQFHNMRLEWQMNFLGSGAKALEFMALTPVDVLVTDMMMPGMDGAQLLVEVRDRHPKTVRLVLSGHSDRESIMKLVGPAHQYLSKPCNTQELRTAISSSFALRDLLLNEDLKQLTTRLSSLPVLPTLYLELTDELGRKDPSVENISEIISQDVGMTSKIMQLVNSAFFGLPQPISGAKEAVHYLGMRTIRDLVLSLHVFGQFDQSSIRGFSIEALSQHCCQTAALARKIAAAEHCDANFQEECFLAGLLHDVGQLILASSLPKQYAGVIENARLKKLPIWEAEHAEYGVTHAEVGGYLLALWGLPVPVIEAVSFHHRPRECTHAGFSPTIPVHVANVFAHDLATSHADWPGNKVDLACLTSLGLEERFGHWKQKLLTENRALPGRP
jgi:HD-like signal output (HDOD) protein